MNQEASEFMTVSEVMARLHIGRSTVFRLQKAGRLKAYRFGIGRAVRFRRADVDRFIQESENHSQEVKPDG